MPFDHDDPRAGGWTILANLHPLCVSHHQAKTAKLWFCAKIAGDAIFWQSTTGLRRITLPTYTTVFVPDTYQHREAARQDAPPGAGVPGVGQDLVVTRESPFPPGGMPMPPPAGTHSAPVDSDLLYEPTWWEQNIGTDGSPATWHTHAPTLADIARLTDPLARSDAIHLRDRYLEHQLIVAVRERLRPPPF